MKQKQLNVMGCFLFYYHYTTILLPPLPYLLQLISYSVTFAKNLIKSK